MVYFIENVFTDSTYFVFRRVDQSYFRVVFKIWFVVFQRNKTLKHSFLPFVNIRFNIPLSLMSFFPSVFILLLASLQVVVIEWFSIFWYYTFFNLYRLDVLSANINVVPLLWIVFMSSFNLFCKLLFVFRSFHDLIISNKSLSNWINSLTWGGQFKDLRP